MGRQLADAHAGPFPSKPIDRSHDKYGRALVMMTREGESLGAALVSEGLAEEWRIMAGLVNRALGTDTRLRTAKVAAPSLVCA